MIGDFAMLCHFPVQFFSRLPKFSAARFCDQMVEIGGACIVPLRRMSRTKTQGMMVGHGNAWHVQGTTKHLRPDGMFLGPGVVLTLCIWRVTEVI